MVQDNFTICYQGFEPPPEFCSDLNERLSNVLLHGPSDSFASVLVRKKSQLYEASIKLSSSSEAFLTSVRRADLDDLAETLIDHLDRRLDRWREDRFLVGRTTVPVWASKSWSKRARSLHSWRIRPSSRS